MNIADCPKKTLIGEVKQVHVGTTNYLRRRRNPARRYGSSECDREVDRRAQEIKAEYIKKAQRLDRRFGGTPEGTKGQFEASLDSFAHGGVQPIVYGTFGEVNKDFDTLVKTLARIAVENDEGFVQGLPFAFAEVGKVCHGSCRV